MGRGPGGGVKKKFAPSSFMARYGTDHFADWMSATCSFADTDYIRGQQFLLFKKLTKIDGFGKKTFAICWVTNVLDIAAVERPKGQFK